MTGRLQYKVGLDDNLSALDVTDESALAFTVCDHHGCRLVSATFQNILLIRADDHQQRHRTRVIAPLRKRGCKRIASRHKLTSS